MGPPLPLVEGDDPVEVAFEQLQSAPAVVVARGGRAAGVLTRSDLLEFLAHRQRP
jgi:predicted transcriptional regulator